MLQLGIDLGGSKIEGVVLDPEGREQFRKRIQTEQELGYAHILHQIGNLYLMMMRHTGKEETTFGIGTPGAISRTTGLLRNSNTQCLNGKPLKQDIEKLLGRNIAFENDANCLAIAEAKLGAGRGQSLVFGVIMGTGCGGGIVHNGKMIAGSMAIAGEWGHHTIDPAGPACWCGKRGCAETLISGGGLEKRWDDLHETKKSLIEIVEGYRQGLTFEKAFMKEFFMNYGRALSNVINILDPDIVILAGGVSNIKELYTEGYKEVTKNIFSDNFTTPIVQHTLGDSAGVIGAALIGI